MAISNRFTGRLWRQIQAAVQALQSGGATVSQTVYEADGAITFTATFSTAIISKGSAAAMTLAAPVVDGIHIPIINATEFAHVITAPGALFFGDLFFDAAPGEPGNTLTLMNKIGRPCELISYDGKWHLSGPGAQVSTV